MVERVVVLRENDDVDGDCHELQAEHVTTVSQERVSQRV